MSLEQQPNSEPYPAESMAPLAADASQLGYWQRLKSLWHAGKEDYHTAGFSQKVGLLATAGWLAYEWGPGNETVTPYIAAAVLERTDGYSGAAVTAAVAGGFTFVQQTASGMTTAATVSTFPRLAGTACEFADSKSAKDPGDRSWKNLGKWRQFDYAFLGGSSFVVTREAAATGNTDATYLKKQAVRSAAIAGGTVAALGAGLDTLSQSAQGTSMENEADIVVDIASNPLTWIGYVVARYGLPAAIAKVRQYRQAEQLEAPQA